MRETKNKTSEGFEVRKGHPEWGVVHDQIYRETESGTISGVCWAGDGRMVEGLFTLPTLAACGVWILGQEVLQGS